MIRIAQILGLLGGVGGTILTSLIVIITRARRIVRPPGTGGRLIMGISIWSYVVFLFAVLGIIGVALVKSKPKTGGILMIISGIGGLVAVAFMISVTGHVSDADWVAGVFSLLVLTSGILGIISAFKQPAQKKPD
jgi:hypothetical protein